MSVYRIGVELALVGNLRAGLAAISADLLGMRNQVGLLNKAFAGIAPAVKGAIAAFAGYEMGKGLMDASKHADKLLHIMKQMQNQGWDGNQLRQAHDRAFQLSGKYPTVGYEATLEMLKEMAPIVGSREHSLEIAETMTQFAAVIKGVMGEGADIPNQLRMAVKALELKGVMMDPNTGELKMGLFEDYIKGMAKTLVATSGLVTPKDYFQFAQQARAAGVAMDKDYFLTVAPTLMQEMGALRSGTGQMSMFQALVGGQMTKRSAQVLSDAGILSKDFADSYGDQGLTAKKFGELLEKQKFMQNPFDWFQKTVVPYLEGKHGGPLNRTQYIEEMAQWFGNRTAQAMADTLITQGAKIRRDQSLYGQAYDMGSAVDSLGKGDPFMAEIAKTQQFNRMMTSIAEAMAPLRMEVLTALSGLFGSIANFAQAHPEEIMNIAKALGILAGGLIALGSVAVMGTILAALGPAGWLVAGFTALAAALTALQGPLKGLLDPFREAFGQEQRSKLYDKIVKPWQDIFGSGEDEKANSALRGFLQHQKDKAAQTITATGQTMSTEISKLPGMVQPGISAAVAAIGAALSSALAGIASKISVPSIGGAGGAVGKTSWEGAHGGKVIQVHNQINMDGKAVARSVSSHIADSWTFSRSAAYHDGWSGYSAPDQQIVTT